MWILFSFFILIYAQEEQHWKECSAEEHWTEDQVASLFPEYPRSETRTYSNAFGAKFHNFRDEDYEMYWDSGMRGVFNGMFYRNSGSATNTYHGHEFYFTRKGSSKEVYRFKMDKGKVNYFIPPLQETEEYKKYLTKVKEQEQYYIDTGQHWNAPFGRPPPNLFQWEAEFVGQKRIITSKHRHFHCLPDSLSPEDLAKCQEDEDLQVELIVTSLKPPAFYVKGLLSEFETEHIISLGKPKLRRSLAGQSGGFKSESRTSATSWIGARSSTVMQEIYHRAANVLNLPEDLLDEGRNAESLQFVHYKKGEKYNAHHDFGAGNEGRIKSRFITLLLYLNQRPPGALGGETGFPKARGGRGMLAYPPKGDAVMFYNILPDGNYDDLALHEARAPRTDWEKYLCNFWIWDPSR